MKVTALAVQHGFGYLASRQWQPRPRMYDMRGASCSLVLKSFLSWSSAAHMRALVIVLSCLLQIGLTVQADQATNETFSLQSSLPASDNQT